MKFSWPGLQKRALVIRNGGVEAYVMRRAAPVLEAAFGLNEQELFQGYCQSRKRSLFVVLADLAEEDFQLETVPYVIGPTRRQLLARKFEQLYRAMPYRASVSLGREEASAPESKRRDERVLFMALTNQQALNPWLEIMHAARNQVRGVYSLAVVTNWLGSEFGLKGRTALAVTFNRAGLRQVYLENGDARFARLASLPSANIAEAGPRIAAEIVRTQQYLASLRWLRRDGGLLQVLLVCPPGARAAWRAACVNTDRVTFEFADQAAFGAQSAAASADNLYADALWAAGALKTTPKVNFAPGWAREHFTMWRWRAALVTTGAAVCAAGIAAGAILFGQAKTIEHQADRHMAAMSRSNADYQQVAKSFPATRSTPEQLKNAVLALDPLATRPLTPESLFIAISQALLQAPGFELEKIDWSASPTPEGAAPGAVARVRAALPGGAPTAGASPAAERYEVVTLTGRLSQERSATPRRKVMAARAAVDALRRIPGVTVVPLRLPMDVSPTAAIKGGDDEKAADAEPIVVRVSRKVAA